MQYHCITQNSLWPVFPQQQTQPNIHNLEGAFRGAPYPSLHLPTSCEAQFLSCRLIQISPTWFLFFLFFSRIVIAVSEEQHNACLVRSHSSVFLYLYCYFLFPVAFPVFSFFHSEFNFRPSVGVWLPATGAKQRLVYVNG